MPELLKQCDADMDRINGSLFKQRELNVDDKSSVDAVYTIIYVIWADINGII